MKYQRITEMPFDLTDCMETPSGKMLLRSKWISHEYKVFIDKGLGTPIPKGYQKIRVHLVYACKRDGRHKARLVAD